MNYALPPIGVVLIINYIRKSDYSNVNVNIVNCVAVIAGGVVALLLNTGITSLNAMIVTAVISIIGNIIYEKVLNKGGNKNYETRRIK